MSWTTARPEQRRQVWRWGGAARFDHMMDDLDNFKKVSNLFSTFWTPIVKDLKKTNPKLKIIAEQANWFSLGREYFKNAEVDRVFAFYLQLGYRGLIKGTDQSGRQCTY